MNDFNKEPTTNIPTSVRILFLILIMAIIFRIADIKEDRKNSIDSSIEDLYYEIDQLKEENYRLNTELEVLRDDYDNMQFILWDLTDYLEDLN